MSKDKKQAGRIKPDRYLRENTLGHFEAGFRDALKKRRRAAIITPATLFNVGVTDYANGYNAGLHQRAALAGDREQS